MRSIFRIPDEPDWNQTFFRKLCKSTSLEFLRDNGNKDTTQLYGDKIYDIWETCVIIIQLFSVFADEAACMWTIVVVWYFIK